MMLAALTLVSPVATQPHLVAVVDPRSGKAWDAKGHRVPCPISAAELKQFDQENTADRFSMIPDYPNAVNRLIVISTPPNGLPLPTSPNMAFNRGSLLDPSFYSLKPNLHALFARVPPLQRTLDVDVVFSTWPQNTILEFRRDSYDRVKVLKGAELHPRVLVISPWQKLGADLKPYGYFESEKNATSKAMVISDPKPEPFDYIDRVSVDDASGYGLKAAPPEQVGKHRVDAVSTSTGLGHFEIKRQRALRMKSVPMSPR